MGIGWLLVSCSRVVLFHPRRHKKSYNSCRPEKNTVYQFRSSSRYMYKNKMRMRWWWSSAQVPSQPPTTRHRVETVWGVCNSQYDLESAQVIPIDIAQGMFSSPALLSSPCRDLSLCCLTYKVTTNQRQGDMRSDQGKDLGSCKYCWLDLRGRFVSSSSGDGFTSWASSLVPPFVMPSFLSRWPIVSVP